MNIFIGWSGKYSLEMAGALEKLLGDLFEEFKEEFRVAFLSTLPGREWWNELNNMLNSARGGILCLTRQSLASLWLPWEAGRISAKENGFVIPYCLDIDLEKIPFPLVQFQALKADKEGTRILVKNLYKELPATRKSNNDLTRILDRFELEWPEFSDKLEEISRSIGGGSQLQLFESAVREWSNNDHKAEEIVGIIPDINPDERFVIGLCGSAAIGKSTFAGRLASAIKKKKEYTVSVLPTDAFALSRDDKKKYRLQGYEQDSHDLELLKWSVGELIGGNPVCIEPYLHETGRFGAPKLVQPASILIVEGVYSFEAMNYHKIEALPGRKKGGYWVYLDAEPEKAKELKFAADVTSRNKSVEEAFKTLDKNYDSYYRNIRGKYYDLSNYKINVTRYWAYTS